MDFCVNISLYAWSSSRRYWVQLLSDGGLKYSSSPSSAPATEGSNPSSWRDLRINFSVDVRLRLAMDLTRGDGRRDFFKDLDYYCVPTTTGTEQCCSIYQPPCQPHKDGLGKVGQLLADLLRQPGNVEGSLRVWGD